MGFKYLIVGKYRGQSEVVDETDNLEDARYLQAEYRMAFGNDWVISVVKRRVVNV